MGADASSALRPMTGIATPAIGRFSCVIGSRVGVHVEVDEEGDRNVALDREFDDPDAAHLDLALDRLGAVASSRPSIRRTRV